MKSEKSSSKKVVRKAAKTSGKDAAPTALKPEKPGGSTRAKPKTAALAPAPARTRAKEPAPEPPAKIAPVRAKRKSAARPSAPAIPPVLLEGDQPTTAASGPGQRYALGPVPPGEHLGGLPDLGELPEAYGTGQLLLTARDPHWLYARWDFTREQQRKYNAQSMDRHLVLRIFVDEVKEPPFAQVQVHPESTHWFVHVNDAGTKYLAELGYYQANGTWASLRVSAATLTPPDAMSDDTTAQFATIPVEIPFTQILELARTAVRANVPLIEILQQLRANGCEGRQLPAAAGKWTVEQERALASIISMDRVRRVWMGSLEITELIRRQLQHEISSMTAAQFSLPSSPLGGISSITSLSSPFGGGETRRGFWFNVNAELIIYGATEPDAHVTIGGRTIKLRPDGSFSYRFSLPDGQYELPAVAVSADKCDGRAAELKFSRATEYRGDVGAHPQDPQLKPPLAEHVA